MNESVHQQRPLLIRSRPNFCTVEGDVRGQDRLFALQKKVEPYRRRITVNSVTALPIRARDR